MTPPPLLTQGLGDAIDGGRQQLIDLVRRRGGTPLLHGRSATFVFVGDAEQVELRHWMDTFPPIRPFDRVPDTDAWLLTIDLPETARIEYKLAVRRHGRRRLHLDPLNPARAADPTGENSVAAGVRYEQPAWSRPDPLVPQGVIDAFQLQSEHFDEPRTIGLYLPPDPTVGPTPLLVVHDGPEYRNYAALPTVLDNLIAAGEVPPVMAAFLDPTARNTEYAADPRHAAHVVTEVLPAVAARAHFDADRTYALGASLGGVASLHAAWRYPGIFRGLVLQSGSFVTQLGGPFKRGPVFRPVVSFLHELARTPGRLPDVMHLSCGLYDGLHADCLAMAHQLSSGGVDVGWDDRLDGHHWSAWRDLLRSGLTHVLAWSPASSGG